ncbi:MAG: tetraacyldisaccharide 4'-kinase [Saprospiraceae bacterium]|nr:tetraacyldisaccharide 4'-kinase [Saprospiraceae bacterium]
MIRSRILALLLAPFSLLYGLAVSMRNMLYDAEIIKASRFSLPLISVGNISIGGAGKTPHIEYLIRLLQPYINVATLSRGYNRNTTGFRFVSPHDTALVSGDEPLMYARKFQGVPVAVCENRAIAIPQMMQRFHDIQTILLDDAFQHRSVKPYINILLTQHDLLFTRDFLLPSGRLREWRSAYKRADVIIVSKCPEDLSMDDKNRIIKEVRPRPNQQIFFTCYQYERIYQFYDARYVMDVSKEHDILLISAIANTAYLQRYLTEAAGSHFNLQYEDHHNFTAQDIEDIIGHFQQRQTPVRYVLTTEKDAVRLLPFRQRLYEAKIPIFVLPVRVSFLFDGGTEFDSLIVEKLLNFKS